MAGRMTVATARATLAQVGVTIRNTGNGEYRVNLTGAAPGRAYFTDSLEDAVGTGLAMAKGNDAAPVATGEDEPGPVYP